ncbi:hypothetical protein [Kibdelosporangium philippinense]
MGGDSNHAMLYFSSRTTAIHSVVCLREQRMMTIVGIVALTFAAQSG